jgi:hypothetical protein
LFTGKKFLKLVCLSREYFRGAVESLNLGQINFLLFMFTLVVRKEWNEIEIKEKNSKLLKGFKSSIKVKVSDVMIYLN